MASLVVGTLFSSYEELKARIDEYQDQNKLILSVKDSRTVEATKKRLPTRHLNEALKYYELSFACSDCVKNKSWNKSVNNVDVECQMNIRIVATKDGQHLEVRRMNEKHNHPMTGIGKLSIRKKKSITNKNEVNPNVEHDLLSSSCDEKEHGNNIISMEDALATSTTCSEVHKPNLKRKLNNYLPDSINLGKQTERWQCLKAHLNLYSDEELAEVLLNHLEHDFEIQTSNNSIELEVVNPDSRPSFLSTNQLSAKSTATPISKRANLEDDLTVQVIDHASDQQEIEYISHPHENDENNKYNNSTVSHSSPLIGVEPRVITHYMSEQDSPLPPQIIQRDIKPLHECSNEIYQVNGQRSEIILPIIDLGKQYERWTKLKQKLKIETDEGMAKFLIDHQ